MQAVGEAHSKTPPRNRNAFNGIGIRRIATRLPPYHARWQTSPPRSQERARRRHPSALQCSPPSAAERRRNRHGTCWRRRDTWCIATRIVWSINLGRVAVDAACPSVAADRFRSSHQWHRGGQHAAQANISDFFISCITYFNHFRVSANRQAGLLPDGELYTPSRRPLQTGRFWPSPFFIERNETP